MVRSIYCVLAGAGPLFVLAVTAFVKSQLNGGYDWVKDVHCYLLGAFQTFALSQFLTTSIKVYAGN